MYIAVLLLGSEYKALLILYHQSAVFNLFSLLWQVNWIGIMDYNILGVKRTKCIQDSTQILYNCI